MPKLDIKSLLLSIIRDSNLPAQQNLSLVWSTYRFFRNPSAEEEKSISMTLSDFISSDKGELMQELVRHRI